VSLIGSPRRAECHGVEKHGRPPSSWMPTSTNRVRVDDWRTSRPGLAGQRLGFVMTALALDAVAACRILSKSARANFSNDNRCFIFQGFREFAQRKFITQSQNGVTSFYAPCSSQGAPPPGTPLQPAVAAFLPRCRVNAAFPSTARKPVLLLCRVRRLPEIPRRGGAVRTPAFAERQQFLHRRQVAFL